MAKEPAKGGKSETLTIRLDQKNRFILDYLARLRGQTITTIVERAIVAAASAAKVEDPDNYGGELGWDDFWDVSEGVRSLKLTLHRDFYPTFEEDRRLAFARQHWPFFAFSRDFKTFNNIYIDVLWPDIDAYIQIHEDQRSKNYNAAAEAMLKALADAKLPLPEWPVNQGPPPAKKKPSSRDLDDEIPF